MIFLALTAATIIYFILCNAIAMLVTYVQELGANLFQTNEQNCLLLNAMHEGLLILEKRPTSVDMEQSAPRVMFINNPIQKLVSQFMRRRDSGSAPTCEWVSKEKFEPVWTSSAGTSKKLLNMFESSSNFSHKNMSLEQIILVQEDEPKQKNCIYRIRQERSMSDKSKQKSPPNSTESAKVKYL